MMSMNEFYISILNKKDWELGELSHALRVFRRQLSHIRTALALMSMVVHEAHPNDIAFRLCKSEFLAQCSPRHWQPNQTWSPSINSFLIIHHNREKATAKQLTKRVQSKQIFETILGSLGGLKSKDRQRQPYNWAAESHKGGQTSSPTIPSSPNLLLKMTTLLLIKMKILG